MVAIGTSLPELVTAVVAARKGESDLVVGNVLGSNVFNSLMVGGVAGVLDTVELDSTFALNVVVMVFAGVVAGGLLFSGRALARSEGALLFALFALWVGGIGTGILA